MNVSDSPTPLDFGWTLDNSYSQLPETLFVRSLPQPVRSPQLILFNRALAESLGLDLSRTTAESLAEALSGNRRIAGSEPIAQAYAGHQFGGFTMLGDGRAILLAEILTSQGSRFDLQLKGSGRTRFARGGDGRAALGPMLREYLISEAMFGLGIPTTRSLAVVLSGEPVYRETPLPGAVLTRIAASHIRVGTFEYLAASGDHATLRTLADYVIRRHYPELSATDPDRYVALLRAVQARQSRLVAQWLAVGFVHGVMNTDNVSIAGETIDYGPCAFLDQYDPGTVFSSIDRDGRYAYGNQSRICQWNLARFAETLIPLLDADQKKSVALANQVIAEFPQQFQEHWLAEMRRKLGLESSDSEDMSLVQEWMEWMVDSEADYTLAFRKLSALVDPAANDPMFDSSCHAAAFQAWRSHWSTRLLKNSRSATQTMREMELANPAFIPRNHLVEQSLEQASRQGDMTLFNQLLEALANPYEVPRDFADLAQLPPQGQPKYRTFCGT